MNVRAAHSAFYGGIYFRSRLEACWAMFFEAHSIPFEYEKRYCEFNDGTKYQPDFWLPESQSWFEVKGELSELDHRKILNLARSAGPRGESVLLGGSPAGYVFGEVTDWGGWNLNAAFGRCAQCDCWTHAMLGCRHCGHMGSKETGTTFIDLHQPFHRDGCASRCGGGAVFSWQGNSPKRIAVSPAVEKWADESVIALSRFKIVPKEAW